MQLAASSHLPIDPNLLALLFGGAAPAAVAGSATPELARGLGEGAGFAALLPEAIAAAPVAPAAPAGPLNLRGGVPLAILAAPAGELPVVAAPAPKPGEATSRLHPRALRTAAPAAAEVRDLIPAESEPAQPLPDAALLAALGWMPVPPPEPMPVENVTLASDTSQEAPEDLAGDESFERAAPAAGQPEFSGEAAFAPRAHPRRDPAVFPAAPLAAPAAPAPDIAAGRDGSKPHGPGEAQLAPVPALPAAGRVAESVAPTPPPLPRLSPEVEAASHAPANPGEPARLLAANYAGVVAPEMRPPNLPRSSREKIAAAPLASPPPAEDGMLSPEKTFVTTEPEAFAPHRRSLGTEVAKMAATMPASYSAPSFPLPAADVASALAAAPGGLLERVEAHNVLELALDGVSSAHEAVEVVLRTADRLASLTHKSVRLEFSVGDEKLGVRVELRANEVHTTFHTESAELRTALAAEWQAVAASAHAGERTLRLLPAQFGGADQSAANGFSGDASSRHRDAQAQADAAQTFAPAARGRAARAARPAAEPRAIDAAFAAPGTALHLHTLA